MSGDIDILVVKQMASVGLDVDRLKVALDLSNTRTFSAVFQRMMRVGTKWEHPDYPDNPVQTAVYIGPDEPLLEQVIEDIRKEEGPVPIAPSPDIPDGPVDLPPKSSDNPPHPPRGTVFIADGSELSGTLVNYSGIQAPAVYVDLADDFNANFPQASQTVDKASLANWLESRKVAPTVNQVQESRVQDITADLNLWRERCSEDGRKAVNHRYRTRMGTSDWRQSPEVYRSIHIDFWDDHKRKLGIRVSVHLEDIDEVETLQKMHANILRELGR